MSLIRSGVIQPGEQFPSEKELQERLMVSRAVLREALRILEAKGLLISNQGRRRFLRDWTKEPYPEGANIDPLVHLEKISLREIYETRLVLEPVVARWAAERATQQDLDGIAAELGHLRRGERQWRGADFSFHLAVARASNNQMAVSVLRSHYQVQSYYRPEVWTPEGHRKLMAPETTEAWITDHQRIYEAVAARDAEGAAQAMYDHIEQVYRMLSDRD